ncbi:DnaJ sub C member 7 [Physocladia obscura]|uniref:DnaJ sub C member 7 n=1 Tax=Physocladia obscura TaxID=109957 RepID=A0AAD5XL28_9FUNG|nr:DnaJ sub C member 7 [Physocladia obscura]
MSKKRNSTGRAGKKQYREKVVHQVQRQSTEKAILKHERDVAVDTLLDCNQIEQIVDSANGERIDEAEDSDVKEEDDDEESADDDDNDGDVDEGDEKQGCQVRYEGFIPDATWRPPHVDSDIDPVDFHREFIVTRTPAIIRGNILGNSLLAKLFKNRTSEWTAVDGLRDIVGSSQLVEIETRSENQRFGSGRPRKIVSFSDFVEAIKKGDSSVYLSTQYNNNGLFAASSDDDHVHSNTCDHDHEHEHEHHHHNYDVANDEINGGEKYENLLDLYHDYCKAPLARVLSYIPLRPDPIPHLVPQQMNLWMGVAPPEGISSGLHHDYADNLYVLLQGKKQFTIIPPSEAPNLELYGHKDLQVVHENGLISYNWVLGSDGSYAADVARWKCKVALAALQEGLKQSSEGVDVDLEALREDVVEANEEKELAEDEENENMHDYAGDYDSDDDEDEESMFQADDNSNDSDMDIDEMKDDYIADEDEQDEDDSPLSFSRINPKTLHSEEFSLKYPNIPKVTFELKEGEMLYLPASWFHEVRSCPNATPETTTTGPHVALNYWFHPPNSLKTTDYDQPYQTDYWIEQWDKLEELLKGKGKPEPKNDSAKNWTQIVKGSDGEFVVAESMEVGVTSLSNPPQYDTWDDLPVHLKIALKNPGVWVKRSRKDGMFLGVAEAATY